MGNERIFCKYVDDIASFGEGLPLLLGDEGVFIIEAPYLLDLIDKYFLINLS